LNNKVLLKQKMMEEQQQNQKIKKWYQDSILLKLSIITAIILALLIPSSWIQGLITDREDYQHLMLTNVSDKWSGSQLIQGPVLVLPYEKKITETVNNKQTSHVTINNLYVLPQNLQIKADIKTELFESGLYDAVVYNSKVMLQGSFDKPDLSGLDIDPSTILYNKAKLIFSVSDLKGLKNNPDFKIQNQVYSPEPTTGETGPFNNGLQVNFPMQKEQGFTFSYHLDLKGSKELNFLDIGKTMDVEITSDWRHPDFNGRNLPDSRSITNKSLGAKWHMLYYKRPFPQQWINNDTLLSSKKATTDAVFGVKLQLPVDQYRKILRTTKYSTLIILLTFVSLFLTELIKKQSVHLFNYTLIGAAMVVYYILLLSFSEQLGYNYAYLLSSASTIVLISVFTASLLKNRGMAALFAFILSIFYGFIFIIIQLEELSLLFGGIALFIIVATLMYFSRKINWDKH
jgi:inner membrane protein